MLHILCLAAMQRSSQGARGLSV